MGQKVNPIGFRVGINRTWDSRWYADKNSYADLLHEDLELRSYLQSRLQQAGLSKVVIERPARRTMTRHMKRAGRVWIRIFPDIPVSTKPAEVRQGKGKGTPEYWIARVKPGRIMFEIDGVPESIARRAFELAAAKLPNQTKFVQRLGAGD